MDGRAAISGATGGARWCCWGWRSADGRSRQSNNLHRRFADLLHIGSRSEVSTPDENFQAGLYGSLVESFMAIKVMRTQSSISFRPSATAHFSARHLLTRTLMAAALIGGAGAVLSAGSAQANPCADGECTWAEWTTAGNFLTAPGIDKTYTWKSTTIVGDLASSLVRAQEPLPGIYLFNLDLPFFTTTPFDFTYTASITDPHKVFSFVDLDSDAVADAIPPSILTATFTGGSLPITLTSTNGSTDFGDVSGHPTILHVNNFYDGGGAIDSFQTSYRQVDHGPGPLPVLGAGVAFGFSRRLRRRIDGARVKA